MTHSPARSPYIPRVGTTFRKMRKKMRKIRQGKPAWFKSGDTGAPRAVIFPGLFETSIKTKLGRFLLDALRIDQEEEIGKHIRRRRYCG